MIAMRYDRCREGEYVFLGKNGISVYHYNANKKEISVYPLHFSLGQTKVSKIQHFELKDRKARGLIEIDKAESKLDEYDIQNTIEYKSFNISFY